MGVAHGIVELGITITSSIFVGMWQVRNLLASTQIVDVDEVVV
jgi:hypothetical protein